MEKYDHCMLPPPMYELYVPIYIYIVHTFDTIYLKPLNPTLLISSQEASVYIVHTFDAIYLKPLNPAKKLLIHRPPRTHHLPLLHWPGWTDQGIHVSQQLARWHATVPVTRSMPHRQFEPSPNEFKTGIESFVRIQD